MRQTPIRLSLKSGCKGRRKPVEDTDGVITGEYAVKLQPEDKTVEGIIIDRSVLSLEDTYDTDNGTKWKYTADVLKPKTGNQVKFEVVNFNGAGSLRVIITDDGGAACGNYLQKRTGIIAVLQLPQKPVL